MLRKSQGRSKMWRRVSTFRKCGSSGELPPTKTLLWSQSGKRNTILITLLRVPSKRRFCSTLTRNFRKPSTKKRCASLNSSDRKKHRRWRKGSSKKFSCETHPRTQGVTKTSMKTTPKPAQWLNRREWDQAPSRVWARKSWNCRRSGRTSPAKEVPRGMAARAERALCKIAWSLRRPSLICSLKWVLLNRVCLRLELRAKKFSSGLTLQASSPKSLWRKIQIKNLLKMPFSLW